MIFDEASNRTKPLNELILGAPAGFNPEIRGLQYDSRKVKKGDLFFAVPGFLEDGVKYLAQAFEKGAAAAVVREGTVPPAELAGKCIIAFDMR
ncbi:MAG: hypothetical protein EOP11_20740, partial [Proteobacteria bacterium]